jgi:ribose/xylose/arabinose/galactoside ABC-type transport system permease subunit
LKEILRKPQTGLALVIVGLFVGLTLSAGSHMDRVSGHEVNSFLNSSTLFQLATDASFFAIMAAGVALVILTGGIDLSVGSTYALAGVLTAMALRSMDTSAMPGGAVAVLALILCLGIGTACGLLNGLMVVNLGVHPFIITLGTMWIFRGVAFVASHAESVLVPGPLTSAVKATLGLRHDLYPIPLLLMAFVVVGGSVYLSRTVAGRNIVAVGGNPNASYYAGLRLPRVLMGVYALCGVAAGLAAFVGVGYYGSASCADATGYELYVIASAVVGGVSLSGGRGSIGGAALGALLIVLLRQAIITLRVDKNYEWIIIGMAIIAAVFLDRVSTRYNGFQVSADSGSQG